MPAGDGSKSLTQAAKLYDELAAATIERKSPVVALGGGMVGDLTGFVASTWLRGVPFVQCSTTIEADVDAGVGGKTGVNHASGKNMIGAFYQPRLVLQDTDVLHTLDPRDFRAGLAESIKHGAIRDAAFLDGTSRTPHESFRRRRHAHPSARKQRAHQGIGRRRRRARSRPGAILNFGHTIGHAVESLMQYTWRHGECVAVGMVAAARIAARIGIMSADDATRLTHVIRAFELPTAIPAHLSNADIIALTLTDKKVAAGRVRFVFVTRFGETVMRDDVAEADIAAILDELRSGVSKARPE